jgi:hypothetical protein
MENPREHAANVRKMIEDVATHLKQDLGRIDDPAGKALFETSREVLSGLARAFEHYEAAAEPAWREPAPA